MKTTSGLVFLGFLAALASCSSDADKIVEPGSDPKDDTYPYPVGKVFFSHPPIGLEGVFFFESMGALYTPFQEDHGGFFHDELSGPAETTIPVIAPADGQVIMIRTHESHNLPAEYAIGLKVSTTIDLLWGHAGRLSDRLASEAPPLGSSRSVAIPVSAGEVIAWVGNTPLDLAVNDSERQLKILHPEFYGPNPYAAPLEDYFREPLRSQIRALTVREAEPRTGTYGYDVAGTLSGLWYLEGSDPRGPEFRTDIAFHFGYHHIQAHRATVFDGLAPGWSFWIKGNPRMEGITPSSGLVKFELYPSRWGVAGTMPEWTLEDISGLDDEVLTESILLVEMLDDDTVRLERFDAPGTTGISADDVTGFTANARTYHRDPVG